MKNSDGLKVTPLGYEYRRFIPKFDQERTGDPVRLHGFVISALAICLTCLGGQTPLGNAEIVILTGPPGSGKSLQSRKLSKKYKVPVISIPDLIRESLASRSAVLTQLSAAVATGDLIDDQTAIQLISARVNRSDARKGFLLDGYPVSEAQARFLDGFIVRHSLKAPIVVVLEASDAVVRERLRKRADDTRENIDLRLRQYHDEQVFLERWYKSENTIRVDATQLPEVVFQQIETALIDLFQRTKFKTR